MDTKYYKLDGSDSKFASMKDAMDFISSLPVEKAIKFVGGQITGWSEDGKLLQVANVTGVIAGKVQLGKVFNVEGIPESKLKMIRRQRK